MAVNWKRLLTWIIALAFLIGIVISVFNAIGFAPSPSGLIEGTIKLRGMTEAVPRAALITQMDDNVRAIDNPAITAQWTVLSGCVAGSACTQDDYFDFLLMIAMEEPDEVPNSELIVNLLTVNRYWGQPERIIEFSKALTVANDQVRALQMQAIEGKWQEVVRCDGKCPEYHDLFFELVRLLIAM
jgi:hypothetical protein